LQNDQKEKLKTKQGLILIKALKIFQESKLIKKLLHSKTPGIIH